MRAIAERGIRPHRLGEVLQGHLAVGAVGQAREQRADLGDDLGVEGAER